MSKERKVHYDTDPDKHRGFTRCGIEFWREKNVTGEGSTAVGSRVEFVDERKRVTCKACKNGMQADWRIGS